MRRAYGLLIYLLGALFLWVNLAQAACPPTRDNTYIAGTVISPTEVMANENNLYQALQDGIGTDCIADSAVTTAKIATGAVTSADILDGTITSADLAFSVANQILPTGAVFFLFTGSCPSWATDVSATYANKFIRVAPTALATGGASTHTHTGPSHSHTVPASSAVWTQISRSGFNNYLATTAADTTSGTSADPATSSSGTGTTSSGDSNPEYVTAKLCQVN